MLTFQAMSGFYYASEPNTETNGGAVTLQVIARIQLSASKCREMYLEMEGYSAWNSDLADAVAEIVGEIGLIGNITKIAYYIQKINFTLAKNNLKKGWQSGKGCTMLVYDNATPTILVNS